MKDWANHLDDAHRAIKAEMVKPDASEASMFCDWVVAAFEGQANVAAAKIVSMALAGDFGIELRNKFQSQLESEGETRALAAESEMLEAA